ncbi:MAG TPA: hypothetical protein IAA83_00670 [Candidatus Avoscillospira avistercoris]|uniref:Lipoprotein n=1 Tax=Candidatus Avoscillospira avistercoris TaxID=2840707 RepID=A0A9D1F7E3_9FIRM|nr:hypothetical protein [Candidatus Avoscillospira avistercoris]
MGKNVWKALGTAGALLLLLAGCGEAEKAPSLPNNYVFGQEMLPAMGEEQGVGTEQGVSCEVTTDSETGETIYTYSGLTSGQETAAAYLEALETQYGCSAMDEEGVRQSNASAADAEGSILVGKDMADGSGILSLDIQWTETTCQLTASILEGMKLQDPAEPEKEPIGVTAAVATLKAMTPEELGVPEGETYTVYADDGYIMVDDEACYRLKLYRRTAVDTREIVGTYLMSLDGSSVYRVNEDNQAEPLNRS